MIAIKEAFENWKSDILPHVIAQCGEDDGPAMAESWNDYTDSLCKDGDLSDLQYHYCPSYDDGMPDDDAEFIIEQMGVTFEIEQIDSRPDDLNEESEWSRSASHWKIKIQRNGESMELFYSMGSAHKVMDTTDVMQNVISDCGGVDISNGFEDWADDCGYDRDSRRAERIYNAVCAQFQDLRRLFSDSELNQLSELFEDR